jgi:[ribosomal protein S5]-alanine N-acetyltransferase
MPTITTRRLLLRPLHAGDGAALERILADPTTMRCWPSPSSPPQVAAWLGAECGLDCRFAVCLRPDGRLIGEAGTSAAVLDGVGSLMLSWIIQAPYWERGYAAEAAGAIRDDAFTRLGAAQLHACLGVDHGAVRRVAERIGMTLLGELDQAAPGLGRASLYVIERASAPAS